MSAINEKKGADASRSSVGGAARPGPVWRAALRSSPASPWDAGAAPLPRQPNLPKIATCCLIDLFVMNLARGRDSLKLIDYCNELRVSYHNKPFCTNKRRDDKALGLALPFALERGFAT